MEASLYAHVPFCSSRCSYCDFHSAALGQVALGAASEAWLRAVGRHIAALGRRFGRSGYGTVYVGGGTPSWLPRETLRRALDLIGEAARAGGVEPAEWTVEANPEDSSGELLATLASSGVSRLSVGVQSLEDDARRAAGRRGDAGAVSRRLEDIAARWGNRWSVDLMFGLPGQSAEGIGRDAAYLVGLGLGHVSLYELTLEEGTPMHRAASAGHVRLPDDDEKADQYEAAAEALTEAGFERYEVSNWAIPGEESLHNGVYWSMGDWDAVGPSGVGNVAIADGTFLRLENSRDDGRYADDPAGSAFEYVVSGKDAAFEALMTALRTARGLDLARFQRRFDIDPMAAFGKLHEVFPDLVRFDGTAWRATERGLDTLNVPLVSALSSADLYFDTRGAMNGEERR